MASLKGIRSVAWVSVGLVTVIVFIMSILFERGRRKSASRQWRSLKEHSEHLEEMVEERTRELKDAQEQLVRSEKLAVIGQLASGVCHELRNPLGVIGNSAYYLNTKLKDADEKVIKHVNKRELKR